MSTATCPCCGNKESVPASSRSRRLTCSNCGTPFLAGVASSPPSTAPEPAPPIVAIEPVPLPPKPKRPGTPPPRPVQRPKEPKKRPAQKQDTPLPASNWETPTDATPAKGSGDDVFVPKRSRKRSSGCSIAMILGVVAFFGVLLCGGFGTVAYVVLRNRVDDAAAAATEQGGGGTEKAMAPATAFADPKTGIARAGEVRVSIALAGVDFIKGTEGGGEFKSKEKLLALRLRIENASSSQKVDYTGWGAAGTPDNADLPRLTDEHGTSYKLITFGGERRVEGQVRSATIGAGKSISDIIVFDPPAENAQALTLELPTRNIGGTGAIGFHLPRSAIRIGTSPQERSVPELVRTLREAEGPERLEAAKTLAARGPASAMASKQLGETLKDKDPALRLAAAQALARIGVTAHVAYPALVRALGDSDAAVRAAVKDALGKVGDPLRNDVPDLAEAVKDRHPTVRLFALQTLAKMDLDAKTVAPIFAVAVKDSDRNLRLQGVQALGKAGPKAREAALPALLLALRDTDPAVRKAAGEAMAGLGPPAASDLPALRNALREKDAPPELRAQAARSLGALGPGARDAVPELAEALGAPEVSVRRAAAAALAHLGPAAKAALLPLIDALGDKEKDKEVRRLALEALGKLGAEGKLASADAANLIDDPDPAIRKAAAAALAEIDPGAALSAYSRALFARNEGVRLDAAEFLAHLGPKARSRAADLSAALTEKNDAVRLKVARALTLADPMSSDPVPVLAAFLSSKDVAVRREASEGLAAVRASIREAIPALTRALKDDDATVRGNAVLALVRLGAEARPALKNLISALQDRTSHVPIADLLLKLGPETSVPELIKALKDKEPAVRQGAAQALQKFGGDARDASLPLENALKVEKDEAVKKAMRAAVKVIQAKS